MPIAPQQLDFDSLMFKDRTVLYVSECAAKLNVVEQHVIDLIEEGELPAINVGGGFDSVRVPRSWLVKLAARLAVTEAQLFTEIDAAKKAAPRTRNSYRIPVEGWEYFVARRRC